MSSLAPPPRNSPSTQTATRFALVVIAIGVLVYSLSPFEPSLVVAEFPDRLREAFNPQAPDLGLKLVGHFFAFLMLGTAIELAFGPRLREIRILPLICLVALGCLIVETLQFIQSDRHARVVDLICNITAVSGAILLLGRLDATKPVRLALVRVLTQRMDLWMAGLFTIGFVAWISAGLYPAFFLQTKSWDSGMEFCLVNETDGSRPWLGNLAFVGLYDRSLSKSAVEDLNEAASPEDRDAARIRLGLALGYSFDESPSGQILPSGTIASPDFAIPLPDEYISTTSNPSALVIDEPISLRPDHPVGPLAERLIESGAFSIEVGIKAMDTLQTGPARIVTWSDGPYRRNFTLAQDGADLEFRVRNGVNGENGLVHALRIRGAVDASPQRFFATYDHGVSTIRDQTGRSLSSVDLREPFVYLGLGANEGGRIAGALLLVCLVGLPLSLLLHRQPPVSRHAIALSTVMIIGSLPFLATCLQVGGPLHLNLLFWNLVACCTAYPLLLGFVSSGQERAASEATGIR
ncbi:MAG: VanZ family protein [Opitutaceae bacterium]